VPRFRYELVRCATSGHELVGTDAARVTPADDVVVREGEGIRWHRCLRCDSWLPLPPPEQPTRQTLPPLQEIEVPLRGKPLRDRYVLRLIAIDRALHFLVLAVLAAFIFLFALNHRSVDAFLHRLIDEIQGATSGPVNSSHHGVVYELRRIATVHTKNLYLAGVAVGAYALLEGVEAVGLWWARRWAEYLTFVATTLFVPYEVYELIKSVTWVKALTLAINLAIAVYLLFAKRLFGLRGGAAAEERERRLDTGWAAIERSTWWKEQPGAAHDAAAGPADGPRPRSSTVG
jgi:uncharacterized membrane protein (DUF2068 family)